jgi:autotransporter-associated beta strand protein
MTKNYAYFLSAMLCAFLSFSAFSQTDRYWSGGGASDNIDQGGNWFNGNPSSGDNLYFNNTTGIRHYANSNYGAGSFFNFIITYNGAGGIRWTGDRTYANKFENNNDGTSFDIAGAIDNRGGSDMQINPVGNGGINIMASSTVTIETGKIIKVFGLNTLTVNGIIAGGGGLALQAGGPTVILQGAAANTYTGPTTIAGGLLRLNKSGGGTIPSGNSITVTGGTLEVSTSQTLSSLTLNGGSVAVTGGATLTVGTLTLTSGKVTLSGTGNLVANTVSGGSASAYVATTGTGTLTINNVPASATLFPIGTSASANNYDPVMLTPASTGATFSARVKSSITNTLSPNSGNSALIVNREWDITRTGTASNTTLAFTPAAASIATNVNGSMTRPANGATAVIGHWNGSSWDANIAATHNSGTWTTDAAYSGAFSPFIVASPGAVLSVELADFSVKSKENATLLTWQTASEKDNALFQIERSANGTDFSPIGEVKGAGNSAATKNYTFTDVSPLTGTNYYRLKAVDYNGAATLSKVVSVSFSSKNDGKIAIYPNPTRNELRLDFDATDAGTTLVQVSDLMGRVVLSQNFTVAKGANLLPFNVASLPSGTYFVKVNGDVTRFVKQ